MENQTFPGVLVDITVLVVTLVAVKLGLIPGTVLVGVISAYAGGKAVLASRKGPPGPGGGTAARAAGSVSGAMALGVGVAIMSLMGRNASTAS